MLTMLPPADNSIYNSPSAEPQRIALRQPNQATLCFDTFDSVSASKKRFQFSGGRMVLGGMKRFSPADLNIFWHGLNVNPTNNVVRFSYGTVGVQLSYEATVAVGSYTTVATLMDALVGAMNSAVGSSFSWTSNPLVPGFGTLSAAKPFKFLSSPGVDYGRFLWNLPKSDYATSITIGQVGLIYTRYIDVVSRALTQYVKLPNLTTSSTGYPTPGNLVGRFHLPATAATAAGYYELSKRIQSYQNFEISNDLQDADLEFRDEWGQPLYLHDNNEIILDVYIEA